MIRARSDGMIGDVKVRIGQLVAPGDIVASITGDVGSLEVIALMPGEDRPRLAPGMTLLAVNGRGYKPERLEAAVTANRDGSAPLQLLVKDGDRYSTVRIDWRGGLRYPQLERINGTPDRLAALYRARP